MGRRSMIAELATTMQDSSRYDKYSLDQIKVLATEEVDRKLSTLSKEELLKMVIEGERMEYFTTGGPVAAKPAVQR